MGISIKVKCPNCHAILTCSCESLEKFNEAMLTCPKCKYKAQGFVYRANGLDKGGHGCSEDQTQLGNLYQQNKSDYGQIRCKESGRVYQLKEGVNVIGRQASTSTADIQIPGDPYMSRQHASIKVIKISGVIQHQLEEIGSRNIIEYNGNKIQKGEILKLSFGDVLMFGKTEIVFEETDEEATKFE